MKKIVIDFMYLDLRTCERCIATDDNLDCALSLLSEALMKLGYTVERNKIEMETRELAEKYHFKSSPTIRVNGIDICGEIKECWCKDCGDLCDDDVDCRVFLYEGKEFDQPPVPMIIDGILKVLYGNLSPVVEEEYRLPDNLDRFFKSKYLKSDDIPLLKRCC
jgi:Protein of unknown function (DUF2703).